MSSAGAAGAIPDLRVLVGGVIIEDHVNRLAGRDVALQRLEEADERLEPVAAMIALVPSPSALNRMIRARMIRARQTRF
jgi:hypothetical protein